MMGCAVDNLDLAESLAVIEGFIRSGQPHRHGTLSGACIVKARRDRGLHRIIDGCDLISAEGRPLCWASRLLGKPLKARVARRDIFEALMARAAQKGWSVFLLGARDDEAGSVVRRHPGLILAGHRSGGWLPAEEDEVAAGVRAARPDILCVALGSPAAEAFLARHQAVMKVPFAMGAAGGFYMTTRPAKRPPRWMRQTGLAWLHRVLQGARPGSGRHLVEDLAFVALFAREWVRR